jgi:magnesium transporter
MMKKLYSGLIEDLDNIKDSIISAESHTFSGDEREMVAVLSNLSRELIDIKQTARMHHGVWEQMVAYADKEYFGAGFGSYIHDIRDQFNLIHEIIVNCRELLADLRETNDSLLNTKQNDIIKRLTMVSFIFIPITFVAALFTIPAVKVPFIDGDFGWVILLLIMILISAGTLSYFKRKKWM